MNWHYSDNVLSHLEIDGENVVLPWGVETADSSAFFSLQKGVGYRHTIESFSQDIGPDQVTTTIKCKMKQGRWKLVCVDSFFDKKINRKARLECLERSVFMDFVLRFRFQKSFFPKAWIQDKWYEHKNSNIYYQFPVREAKLAGKNRMAIKINDAITTGPFSPMMYIRDRHDEWIVHARMIPTKSSFDTIKMCNRFMGTRPLPQFATNFLLSIKSLKKALWYRGERSPYKSRIMRLLNPCAFPMVELEKGSVLEWDVDVIWD